MFEIMIRILPVFLVIGVGCLLKVLKAAGDSWVETLNRYGLYIGFPVLVFETLSRLDMSVLREQLPVIRFNVILLLVVLAAFTVPLKLFRVRKDLANSFIICTFFGNIAYLGYPIVTMLYPQAEGQLAVVIAVYVVLLFTVGITILELSASRKAAPLRIVVNIVKNPFIIAILGGAAVIALRVSIPPYMEEALVLIKASASPVVLISLGIFVWRKIPLKNVWGYSLLITVLRLLVVPAIFFVAAKLLRMLPDYTVTVIEAGMPLAVTPFALSSMYPLKRSVIVTAVVLSTALSILTIPLFVSLL
jgi:predicted permease